MSSSAYFVHFPHPGREHQPEGEVMPWNRGPHGRKFMETEGSYLLDTETERSGRVAFWGEWEGPSRVARKWRPDGDLPRYLHHPFWERPTFTGDRQNTDPWVFGDAFRYSNCKQLTGPPRRPTAMQRLTPGSLILFGSGKSGGFVLDTVFVVGERVGEFTPAQGNPLDQDEAFFHSTLDSLTTYTDEITASTFTLFRGATPAARVDGMFSFAPCLPASASDGARFARPRIDLPGILNPKSWQAPAGANKVRAQEEVTAIWHEVVRQVLDQDLALGAHFELPDGDGAITRP